MRKCKTKGCDRPTTGPRGEYCYECREQMLRPVLFQPTANNPTEHRARFHHDYRGSWKADRP